MIISTYILIMYLLLISFYINTHLVECNRLHPDHTSSLNDIFDTIDTNRNGKATADEIKEFIVNTGGSALDDAVEIEDAVRSVFDSLDENKDSTVKREDLGHFWRSQASTLSTEDVCEWAIHSLHMPEEVRSVLWENAVTGYDFPDLIEHEGRLIATELGITKRTLQKRLYRGLVMRLMGMGTLPPPVIDTQIDVGSCGDVMITWGKEETSQKHGFPVHKYLVQRYNPILKMPTEATPNESTYLIMDGGAEAALEDPRSKGISSPSREVVDAWTHWHTVCSGMSSTCIDTDVTPGETYKYRIASWNAIGSSDPIFVHATIPSNCTSEVGHLKDPFDATTYGLFVISAVTRTSELLQFLSSWVFYAAVALGIGCFFVELLYRLIESCKNLHRSQSQIQDAQETCKCSHFDPRAIHLFGVTIPISENVELYIRDVREFLLVHIFEPGKAFLPESFHASLRSISTAAQKNVDNPTGELKYVPSMHTRSPLRLVRQESCTNSDISGSTTVGTSVSGTDATDLKRCFLCKKKFYRIRRPKHYCGKCYRHFCRNCSGHIEHTWPTPCQVKSSCRCKLCI